MAVRAEIGLRTGFGIFSDILPGSVADLIGTNPPYVQTFQGGLLGSVGKAVCGVTVSAARQSRRECLTALSTQPSPQIRDLVWGFPRASFRALLHRQIRQLVFHQSR